tara:strand:+ start:11837 stop:12064 length:228 start_codon:yes stop_codon:yes gene_type:complete
MNKVINIPNVRKFDVEYKGITHGPYTEEKNVSGDVFNTQVYGLYAKDLINVSNLDVGKKVYVNSFGHKVLVRRVA